MISALICFLTCWSQSIKDLSPLLDEYELIRYFAEKRNFDSVEWQSKDLLKKGLEIGDKYAILKAHQFLAWSFAVKGSYDSSIVHQLSCISQIESIPMEDFVLTSDYYHEMENGLHACGFRFSEFMAFDLAEEYYVKAIDFAQKYGHGETQEGRITMFKRSLAGLYDNMGRHEEAIKLAHLILKEMSHDSNFYTQVLNRLAISYYFNGDYDSSIIVLRTKLSRLSAADSLGKNNTFHNMALSFASLKEYDSAELYHQKAFNWLSKDHKQKFINSSLDYARLKIRLGDFYAARQILLEAEPLVQEVEPGHKYEEWYFELYDHLVSISEALGENGAATYYQEKYEEELSIYAKMHRRYNMEEIVDNYFSQLEEEKRHASLKLYGGIISGSFLLILALTFSVNRIQKVKTKKKLEQEIVDHKLAELKALKAQINPHFLFNALNSIQSFILEDKNNVAEAYLVKYGKLMRKILDHSNELTVPLHEELEALQLYVELEQLRVKQGFDFEVKIDENIDSYTTQVPSMVIQPFIENAIWHGVSKLEGRGKIRLEFAAKEDLIEVRIEDNGVGFDTENSSFGDNGSHGIKLIKGRLDLLQRPNQTLGFDIESKIEVGTIVMLRFSGEMM